MAGEACTKYYKDLIKDSGVCLRQPKDNEDLESFALCTLQIEYRASSKE